MPMLSVTATRWRSTRKKMGSVIFKKYSPMGDLTIGRADLRLHAQHHGGVVAVTDRDAWSPCAGVARRDLVESRIT